MIDTKISEEKIWIAGHNGMVGSAIKRVLDQQQRSVITVDRSILDLRNQTHVEFWLRANKPTSIIFAAAKVGGILANSNYAADFISDNLAIQTNVVNGAHKAGVDRLIFLGSSCIYPKFAPQPIPESALMTGPLEPTNQWYAIAKIAGIMTCQAYRRQHGRDYVSIMPCNLYGPKDNFDLENSHVIPALIRKIHEAKTAGLSKVVVWGTGSPLREFLHVDDLARGVVYCLDNYHEYEHINCGAGVDQSIKVIAEMICEVVGFDGEIEFDATKPDGTPRKIMDSQKMRALGWAPTISLREGLASSYCWYLENVLKI
jgi:GDP-L-fucose synthase